MSAIGTAQQHRLPGLRMAPQIQPRRDCGALEDFGGGNRRSELPGGPGGSLRLDHMSELRGGEYVSQPKANA